METFWRRVHKDLWSGILILGLGVVIVIQGSRYTVGSLSHMGPGFFPVALGFILTMCGIAIGAKGYFNSPSIAEVRLTPEWRAWSLIALATVCFIVVAKYFGLALATFAIVFISALADRNNTWKNAAVLAVCVVAVCVVVFWWGLQIQMPLFSWANP